MFRFTGFHPLSLFFRSLLFSVFMSLSAFFYSFFCLLLFPLPIRYRNPLIMAWSRPIIWALKIICRIQYQVEGLENIPQDRVGVIMAKHQSTWECFFLPHLFKQTAMISKRELLWVPFFGWGLALAGPIAIDRSSKKTAMEQILLQGKKCLEENRWIINFPEGTRVECNQVGNYRIGGARLAVETGCPILPVAHNAGRYWSRRQFIKRPGTIHVVIGPLLETAGQTAEQILESTKNWIETTMTKINSTTSFKGNL